MKSSVPMHSEIMDKSFRHTGHQVGHIRKFSVHHSISRIDIAEPTLERFAFWVLKKVDKKRQTLSNAILVSREAYPLMSQP
jgi:hypothetical protein